jgi:hypothetical protein
MLPHAHIPLIGFNPVHFPVLQQCAASAAEGSLESTLPVTGFGRKVVHPFNPSR